jgi:hypothetical protein
MARRGLTAEGFGYENACHYHPPAGGNEPPKPDKRAKRGSSDAHHFPRPTHPRGQTRQGSEEDGHECPEGWECYLYAGLNGSPMYFDLKTTDFHDVIELSERMLSIDEDICDVLEEVRD